MRYINSRFTYLLTYFLSNVAFLHILCFNRNPNTNPNPNLLNLKAKKIECQKSHIRQNSQCFMHPSTYRQKSRVVIEMCQLCICLSLRPWSVDEADTFSSRCCFVVWVHLFLSEISSFSCILRFITQCCRLCGKTHFQSDPLCVEWYIKIYLLPHCDFAGLFW